MIEHSINPFFTVDEAAKFVHPKIRTVDNKRWMELGHCSAGTMDVLLSC